MSRLRPISRLFTAPARLSSTYPPSQTLQVRRFSADHHHGPAKVDFWKDLKNPGNWKEEQFVLISLAGWGLLVYGVIKAIPTKKSEEKNVAVEANGHH